jgi:ribonuclease P protein component
VIGRIPRRVGFTPFRGSRIVREDALSLRFVADSAAGGVRVAFSTPKRIGSAVVRNRLRRQLRALLQERSARLPHGWYLVAVEPRAVDNDWGQLGTTLDRLLASAVAQPRQATQSNHDATVGAM